MDCSPPHPSFHGILQARILEWVAMSSSRGSSRPRDRTHLLHCKEILYRLSHQGSPFCCQQSHKDGNTEAGATASPPPLPHGKRVTVTGRVEMELTASGREAGRTLSPLWPPEWPQEAPQPSGPCLTPTDSTGLSLSKLWATVKDRRGAWSAAVHGVTESDLTERLTSNSNAA